MKKIKFFMGIFMIIPAFADDLTCDIGINELYARFAPITLICNDNQFLPANSTSCSDCPIGYVCNGGQLTFNEKKSQGIDWTQKIKNSANNVCSTNFPSELYATFKPNTITIIWNDGINTTTTQCLYNKKVVLPPDPTRPGYKFGGWRVKRRN